MQDPRQLTHITSVLRLHRHSTSQAMLSKYYYQRGDDITLKIYHPHDSIYCSENQLMIVFLTQRAHSASIKVKDWPNGHVTIDTNIFMEKIKPKHEQPQIFFTLNIFSKLAARGEVLLETC